MAGGITVTGGQAYPQSTFDFSADQRAFAQAAGIAGYINTYFTDGTAAVADGAGNVSGSNENYFIVSSAGTGAQYNLEQYNAIDIQNGTGVTSVIGGFFSNNNLQEIIVGSGGVNYTSIGGNVTMAVAGGNSVFDFTQSSGTNIVDLASGTGSFHGGAGSNTFTAGAGSATMDGGAGGGVFTGGTAGNNVLYGSSGSVTLYGAGNGDYLQGGPSADLLVAGGGNETLVGWSGTDTLVAGSGNDSLIAKGSDTIQLGTGAATVSVVGAYDVTVGGATSLNGSYTGINGPGPASFNLLFAGSGDAASTVLGGLGSYYVAAGQGGGQFTGGSSGGNVMYGEIGAVTITGGGSGDFLEGGQGNDSLIASSGNNVTLVGFGGTDTLVGGSGNDSLIAQGNDYVQLGSGAATVSVTGSNSATVSGATSTDASYGGINTSPSTFNMLFIGSSSASTVLGGGSGSYYMDAKSGGGVFHGGTAGGNVIFGAGSMTIFGAGVNDYMEGGATGTTNLIDASVANGNETLASGGGNATMIGSDSNNDVFNFLKETANNSYTVQGFHIGDTLYLNTANYTYDQGSQTITLNTDSTKIILQGFTGNASGSIGHSGQTPI